MSTLAEPLRVDREMIETRSSPRVILIEGDGISCGELYRRIAKYHRADGTCAGGLSVEDAVEVTKLEEELRGRQRKGRC